MTPGLLHFSDVRVTYGNGFEAARGVSFTLGVGECLAIIGESGCGKTTIARAVLGLLPATAKISGSIKVNGTEVVGATEETLRGLRGIVAGFIPQEPFISFNPIFSVLDHVSEAHRVHGFKPTAESIVRSLEDLGIDNAGRNSLRYPFEWSGGMLQRASIAAASALNPLLIVADEPTSALDADRAYQILSALRATRSAILLVSHDIDLVRQFADTVAVCRRGMIVEVGSVSQIFAEPKHEHTKLLLRNSRTRKDTNESPPSDIAGTETVVEARNVSKVYCGGQRAIHAVEDVSLSVKNGEIVGICGPSGSGKSTLLRLLSTIESPSGGEVLLDNEVAANGRTKRLLCKKARQGFVMPIFQDAGQSLNRTWPIWRIVCEPLDAAHRNDHPTKAEKRKIALQMLGEVGLGSIDIDLSPTQLSVGQCQRVSIARALTARPRLIAADEPTSALDTSNSHAVMELFSAIASKHGTAIVIVSHDQQLLKMYCSRVLRMNRGSLTS